MRWNMTGLQVTLGVVLVCAVFGQKTMLAANNAPVRIAPTLSTSLAPKPVLTDEAKDRWWISETIAQSRKDQPVFFGVRLANTPQAALAEIYSQSYTAGETLAVRLWGCNDLPKEFNGRVRLALKLGDEQFQSREKTVQLAPETAKCIAKYSFDTEDLTSGQYALETSLFDDAGKLVQQQVTMLMIQVPPDEEARRQAKAAKKAKQAAELKAKAEAEKQAAEAEVMKEAELKAKQDAEKQAAADLKAQTKAADKAKKEAEKVAQARIAGDDLAPEAGPENS